MGGALPSHANKTKTHSCRMQWKDPGGGRRGSESVHYANNSRSDGHPHSAWSETSSLPLPLYNPSATICGDRFYLEGEDRSRQHRTAVFACSLSALLQSQPSQPVWCPITDLPAECSTIVTLNGQLLSIGGQGCHGNTYYTNAIYSYNPVTNFWELVNCLPTPRYNCLVAVLPGNKLMVVGGESTRLIDTVEIASVE